MTAKACSLLVALTAIAVSAATLPAGFSETSTSGLSSATAFAIAEDGRIFVCQQSGALRVIRDGSLLPQPFLTVTVDSTGERGLLGVAFDPEFDQNQYVYVYYTTPSPVLRNRVSRFTADGDVAVPGSESVILDLDPLSSATNHNGGAIHFGSDGKLYIAVGDNANGANAQTLTNLHGKMLRIDSDGSIPSDNPFYDTATNEERAIWALGLRNPFTFAVHRSTGRVFINDVGQVTWEEINDGIAGSNYGWPATEGPTDEPAYREPLFAYGHGIGPETGCAIAGGSFYDAEFQQFPPSYEGRYFFADLCSGWIRVYDSDADTASGFAAGITSPVDVHVDRDGSLYYLARGTGSLHRVVFTANAVPSIVQHPASATVSIGQSATFEVEATGASPLAYQWQRDGDDIPGANGPSYTLTGATEGDDGAAFHCVVSNPFGEATSDDAVLTVRPPAQRTFVSAAEGSDANPCTTTAPCRQFSAAIPRTLAGGEVVVLDSGGYGTTTIDRAVTLVAPAGVHAAVTAFAGNAVTVDAAPADTAVIRGLDLTGLGGATGIDFLAGGALHVEHVSVTGFSGEGILGRSAGGRVQVRSTISRNNAHGFRFESAGDPIVATLDSIRAEGNANRGLWVSQGSSVVITRSVLSGSGANAYVDGGGALSLDGCTLVMGTHGIHAVEGTARVSSSTIAGNATGVETGPGGMTVSFGDNALAGNGVNGTFGTTVPEQ